MIWGTNCEKWKKSLCAKCIRSLCEPRMNSGIGLGYPLINKDWLKVVFWVQRKYQNNFCHYNFQFLTILSQAVVLLIVKWPNIEFWNGMAHNNSSPQGTCELKQQCWGLEFWNPPKANRENEVKYLAIKRLLLKPWKLTNL